MEKSLRQKLWEALYEVTDHTACVSYDKLADRYELTWQGRVAFVSQAKTERYKDNLAYLVTGIVRQANEKHPILPNQPLYERMDVVRAIERALRDILDEAGLTVSASTGNPAEDVVGLRESIVVRLKAVHKEDSSNA